MHEGEDQVQRSRDAGASGYVPKRADAKELVSAIRSAANGDSCWPTTLDRKEHLGGADETSETAEPDPHEVLTEREKEVLQLIAEGYSNRLIGRQLHISVHTVDTHRVHLMDKLDIHKATELTRYAMEVGLVD